MKVKIKKNCQCEKYLHESINYPRKGLVPRNFKVDELYKVVKTWNNFYGKYYQIEMEDGYNADISVHNAVILL